MTKLPVASSTLAALVCAALCGAAAGRYMDLSLWEPAFPGILVAVTMLGAAVLVRLARNAPITAPNTFDDADLKSFFDALETLAHRLFAIFVQVVIAVGIIIIAIIVNKNLPSGEAWLSVAPYCSGALAFFLIWLAARLIEMAHGDIGFIRLQRDIISHAVARDRSKEASLKVVAPVEFRSAGGYGRALPRLDDV